MSERMELIADNRGYWGYRELTEKELKSVAGGGCGCGCGCGCGAGAADADATAEDSFGTCTASAVDTALDALGSFLTDVSREVTGIVGPEPAPITAPTAGDLRG